MKPISPSEITPKEMYINRRSFMKAAGLVAGAAALAACAPNAVSSGESTLGPAVPSIGDQTDELNAPVTPFADVTTYNNYYEFAPDKDSVATLARDFPTSPWQVEVYGLVNKPHTFSVDELINLFTPEERIYRLRCVEAWSMVIPWQGFPLHKLLAEVEPTSTARFVRFEAVYDPEEMPGQKSAFYPWPYQEGLRLDEAMNDLTIMATGLYGGGLPPQDGGPIRLVVPWKYGFKSIKAVIKIELTDIQPSTMWSTIAPDEYGFMANVNPNVDHPRWSQSSERRIGELGRRSTLMFNGYEEEVAALYEGMDLRVNY
jgi:methionine sulfoxide reductase catalytic subunit